MELIRQLEEKSSHFIVAAMLFLSCFLHFSLPAKLIHYPFLYLSPHFMCVYMSTNLVSAGGSTYCMPL